MDFQLARYAVTVAVIVAVYYGLMWFTPFPRLTRERQFLVFGGIGFVMLLTVGLIWP